jgi:alkylation response protein AidB-like acyl-CoA dehydrogenase
MEPTARVADYISRFSAFHDDVVRPLEAELDRARVGTSWQPALDAAGRMHPTVWEARREVQRRAAQSDLYAPHLPETLGGLGFSRAETMLAEEAVYRTAGLGLGLAALAWTEGPGPHLLHAGEELRRSFVEPLVGAWITAAFANTEPKAGSDVLNMETRAVRTRDGWVINGRKKWITNAHYCDAAQVVAVTEPGARTRSLTMFLVEADRPGFRRGENNHTILEDGLTGELSFEDVEVPDGNRIGETGQGFDLAMIFINWRRLCRGGMCAGWNRILIDRAVAWARERMSGGQPIAALQSVRHQLADMEADAYAARATSLLAQRELDGIGPYALPSTSGARRLISLLKLVNDEAFFRVADRAVQIRGAEGLRHGSIEEKMFRLARNLRVPAGTVEIQRNSIARELLAGG